MGKERFWEAGWIRTKEKHERASREEEGTGGAGGWVSKGRVTIRD